MKNWLIIVLLFSPFALLAQRIMVSEDLPLRNDIAYELIGDMKGHMLLFRDQSTDFEVQAFDENMRLSWSKPIELDRSRSEFAYLLRSVCGQLLDLSQRESFDCRVVIFVAAGSSLGR